MRKSLFTLLAICMTTWLNAQDFEVPTYYSFEKAEDYAAYTPMILEAAEWWMNTPVNKEKNKRLECGAFLVQWMMGTPDITIGLIPEVMTFVEYDAGENIVAFMIGWVKTILQEDMETRLKKVKNKKEEEMAIGSVGGICAVIDFYEKNRAHLQPNNEIEKYIQLEQKGTLEKTIRKNVKIGLKKAQKSNKEKK